MKENDPFLGTQIGNYYIDEAITAGSFGQVYKAHHIFLQERIAAIKVLHLHLSSADERDQFLREGQILEKLEHPYILRLLDIGFFHQAPYLITAYASGGSLRQKIVQSKRIIPWPTSLGWLLQVGEALAYAHQQQIIHRDLKPDNILLSNKHDALLADFGIASLLSTGSMRHTTTTGTPSYMAPEQFRGFISPQSDQYALGCIAYELATGRRPFEAADFIAMGFKHATEPPIPPRKLNPALSSHVEKAILQAMAKERAQRFPDIPAFLKALQTTNTSQQVRHYTPRALPPVPEARSAIEREPKQRTGRQWIDEGNQLYEKGIPRQALEAYEQALKLNPAMPQLWHNKGVMLSELQYYADALQAFERALQLKNDFALIWHNKGNTLSHLEHYAEALQAYEQALQVDPTFILALHGKGSMLLKLHHYAEALAVYEEIIQRDPGSAIAWNCKGDTLKQLQRYSETMQAYEQALKLDPESLFVQHGKEDIFRQMQNYPEAVQAYEQIIELDPTFILAQTGKEKLVQRLQDKNKADL